MSSSEAEKTIKRIQSHRGVSGILIVNSEGIPIKSTMAKEETQQYSALLSQLSAKAMSAIRTLDPENQMTFLRLRSKKHEIMVAPHKDYLLIVIQNPNPSDSA